MGEVMLDIFDRAGKRPPRQRAKLLGDAPHLFAVAQPVCNQPRTWPARDDVGELAEKIGPAAAVDGDAGDVTEVDFGFLQAIGDGARRETRPVLEPAKPLLFGRGHQLAIAQDAGGRIGVVGVDPEYYQSGAVLSSCSKTLAAFSIEREQFWAGEINGFAAPDAIAGEPLANAIGIDAHQRSRRRLIDDPDAEKARPVGGVK